MGLGDMLDLNNDGDVSGGEAFLAWVLLGHWALP